MPYVVDRTLEVMQPLLRRLPAEPGERDDLAGVYVVGGASALPVVARTLRESWGRRVHRSPHPHGAVAIGLAIAADRETRFELTDRFSRHFGVFRETEHGRAASYDTIFGRDVELPKPGGPKLERVRRYRAAHDVGHFRFFECAAFDAKGAPQGDMAPLTDVYFAFDPARRGQPLQGAPARGSGPADQRALLRRREGVGAGGHHRRGLGVLQRARAGQPPVKRNLTACQVVPSP